ncbi:transposase [Limnoraphis robusta Tam1]|uniref:Transposase n=1 Tax=Limnoraphis robusta CCNP1315 TaxID=3110306 RepID=A0ABU5TRG0_9CYAN|nr:transposase [Limnoraphis robusta]MEA5498497.1 transposase [Limnoraphis robusta BA-68 BA1]MEA5517466.1 transposase [Limnoraphis robusta CCNP1315]MEA5542439.1 transposase [Limnoraphis robusta Tam1]MEA5548962.1 transposase [Limnoraphis robusta CCNP1324]
MVKKKVKKQSKRKKTEKESNIRTDVWQLAMTSEQRRLAILTVAQYRHFLKPLVLISYWNWGNLSGLNSNERVNTLEKLVHKTEDNPNPKYYWYFQKSISRYPSFQKFPSYLRRAAIQDALGIVSSFFTRWDTWNRGERKHRYDKPPRLTVMCNSYPALYKGQQVKYHSNFDAVELKIWNGTDWVWMKNIPVKKHGKSRHIREGAKLLSPSFIANKRSVHLSMPVEVNPQSLPDSDYICAIDIGINTTATCSIIGKDGTVKARKFINPARDIDHRDQRKQRIATKSKLTRKIINQDLPKGFCQGLYRKSKNINKHIAQTVSRQIVELAQKHHVSVIVFEDLSNWKAKGGKQGSLQKQRFHQWCKDKLVELTIQKFSELGGKVSKINAKYTSAYAFDGSGLIKRSNKKYSQAIFENNLRYNADLSASYNIGARYWYAVLTNSKFTRVWEGKSSSQTLRTPVTLSTLWGLSKA